MLVCSNIPGNDCKPIPTPVKEFSTYHECAYYGYDYSGSLLRSMGDVMLMSIKCTLCFLAKKIRLFDNVSKLC